MKRCFIFILAAALCLTGCGKKADEATAQLFAMDTVMDRTAYGSQVDAALTSAEDTIRELETQLSRTQADSLVSRLNREGAFQGVSDDSLALMARALEYRDATGGAFDITIAPVMDAWGFTGDAYRVPTQAELDTLLEHVNSD